MCLAVTAWKIAYGIFTIDLLPSSHCSSTASSVVILLQRVRLPQVFEQTQTVQVFEQTQTVQVFEQTQRVQVFERMKINGTAYDL